MSFKLGNFIVDEILFATAQDFNDKLLYTLDQLSTASIEVSAENIEVVDKKGNVVRQIWRNKSATFNSTNAFLHPAILNAGSGSKIINAGAGTAAQKMPKMLAVEPGKKVDITDMENGSLHVIGLYGSGANTDELTEAVSPDHASVADNTYEITTKTVEEGGVQVTKTMLNLPEVPSGYTDEAPVQYVVCYTRSVESGIVLMNSANDVPDAVHLTLYCSYVDPCSDTLRPCYVYIPSFMPDPNMTISLDSETQEVDFNGAIQISYCSADKVLYYIYFPDENIITSGTV